MSFDALAWAGRCQPGSAARKLVLLALADRHNPETGLSYPSVAWLVEWTGLNRKTVMSCLDDLESAGMISDSGQRAGRTGQVKAYVLHLETVPKTELLKRPKNGTVKQAQKRDTIPKTGPLKSTVFSSKESQKRDTEPVREPVYIPDGISHASEKPKSSAKRRPEKVEAERPDDVSEETWRDFKSLRARKSAPLTDTALKAIRKEAEKAGWSIEAALTECVMRGWQGFKADWVEKRQGFGNRGSPETYSSADRDRIRQKYGMAQ